MNQPASPMAYVGNGCHQICFVSRDLYATQRFLNDSVGVGRFRVFEDISFEDLRYRGQPAGFRVHLSLAYAGDVQIEVIQPLAGKSLYSEFLDSGRSGLHHMGFIVEDYERAVRDFEAQGYPVVQSGRFGEATRFAYFDTEAVCGSIMEIFQLDDTARALFAAIKRGDF